VSAGYVLRRRELVGLEGGGNWGRKACHGVPTLISHRESETVNGTFGSDVFGRGVGKRWPSATGMPAVLTLN